MILTERTLTRIIKCIGLSRLPAHLTAVSRTGLCQYSFTRLLLPRQFAGHLPVLYRGTRNVHKLCYMTVKIRAVPSLHCDNFRLKNQDPARCLRRVTCQPCRQAPRYPDMQCRDLTLGPLYCRAVMGKPLITLQLSAYLKNTASLTA